MPTDSCSSDDRSSPSTVSDNTDKDSDSDAISVASFSVSDMTSTDTDMSVAAPPYSPISANTENTEENAPEQSVDSNDCSAAMEPLLIPSVGWCRYKLVMDNVDKNLRPSFQRVDRQTASLHYVHIYAVKDRIDLSSLSDRFPVSVTVKPSDILPTSSDLSMVSLKQHFQILVSRLVQPAI